MMAAAKSYACGYTPPPELGLDQICLSSDGQALTGLWFAGSNERDLGDLELAPELPIFAEVRQWLDVYFSGEAPSFRPVLHLPTSASQFQREVWQLLLRIPFGQTTTYGELAQRIAQRRGLAKMSAQAVGGALGKNPICLIVPCHRVIGADGKITGYAGGIENKRHLLEFERRCVG